MRIHTFKRDDQTFSVEAHNYEQALDTLIYYVGGVLEANLWIYLAE